MAVRNPFRRIRIVFQRSSTTLKLVLLAALLISTVTLVSLRFALQAEKEKTEELRQESIILEQENQKLNRKNALLGTVEGIKELAIEFLNLVEPGTTFFTPMNPEQ